MKSLISLLIFLLIGTSIIEASVGKITGLSGNATLERGSNTLPAKLGSSLEAKDSIVTTNDAKVQLTFNDNTIITVGKKSKFSIEEYLFDATTESTAKFNMVNGTIRAMSGKIGKIAPDRFAVKTKTATIGIRGTDFIIQTSESGESQFFCMQGAITIRSSDGEGMILIPAGSYVTMSPSGVISEVKAFTPAEINTLLKSGLSVTAVHTNEETTQIEPDSIGDTVSQTSNESLDRDSSVNVEDLTTEVASTLTTEVLNNTIDNTPPQIFTGLSTYLVRPQDGMGVNSGDGELTLTSTPSSQSVTGSIIDTIMEMVITLGSTNSYSAVDQFDIKLASIFIPGGSGSLESTSHIVSASDTQNDYFSWGEWTIDPNPMSPSDNIFHGYWAAGVETPDSVINGLRTASIAAAAAPISYAGSVIGEVQHLNSDGFYISTDAMTSGTSNIDVDFGQDTFAATFSFSAGDSYVLAYDGSTASNKLQSSNISNLTSDTYMSFMGEYPTGAMNGAFYGSDGKMVGGTFNASSTLPGSGDSIKIQGAFKATETIANINGGMSPP